MIQSDLFMQLRLKVTPNARSNEILGWADDPRAGRVLRVRLQAPPVDGKANKALLTYLAKEFGLAKSALTLVNGQTSRIKVVELPDGTNCGQ